MLISPFRSAPARRDFARVNLSPGVGTLAAALWLVLPGCIVQDIHDDLAATRANVERIGAIVPALEQTNALLRETNGRLDETTRSLKQMHALLHTTDQHVGSADQRLARLDTMDESLRHLDEHLATLRKIVENIDHAVPLINFTKGTPPVDVQKSENRPPPPR